LLIYTSGTTGPPKGALNAHRCLPGNLPGFELSQNFYPREQDLMWTPADWAWTGGLLDALLPALHYGVPVLGTVGGRFDPEQACRLMGKYRVRNAFIPPTAMKMLMQVDSPKRKHGLRLRSIMSAGEQVGAEVVRWASEELDVGVNEMWGQTEFNYLAGNCTQVMPVQPGSMGKPYPGHNVEPVNNSGDPMPDGEVGELAARRDDPVFFLGYWGQQEATREQFIGDYWGTGDLGYRDADGYLWFVGRKDDVISSAGHRIGPGEIEDCLIKHEAVAQAAVIGSPDELRGEVVKAFIILADGQTPSEALAQNIQQSVKQRLAAHEYPREIAFVDSLPMTTTGKIRRIELREQEIERKRGR
jgi:acetyl-CoA synthetase